MSANQPLVINGWNIFGHALFLNQLQELLMQVEHLRQKSPKDYKKKNVTKCLAAVAKLAFDVVPQDPTRSNYRQGTTLGDGYKHWFRAKFFQQYRLRARLSSSPGLTMKTLSGPMKVIQMLIKFLRKRLKVVTLQMIGMTYSKRQKVQLIV